MNQHAIIAIGMLCYNVCPTIRVSLATPLLVLTGYGCVAMHAFRAFSIPRPLNTRLPLAGF